MPSRKTEATQPAVKGRARVRARARARARYG